MAGLVSRRVRAAYAGWNSDSAPDYLGEAQAPFIENLFSRPGRLVMRGPISQGYSLGYGAVQQLMAGHMVKDDRILLCAGSAAGTYSSRHIDLTTGVVTNLVTPANQNFNSRYAQIGNYTYAFQQGGTLNLMRWDGTAVNPTPIATAVAPAGGADLIAHAERLFVGGASIGGVGGAHTIHFSDPGGPAALALTDWQDNVSGLTNQIVVGDQTSSDVFVAFARIGKDLAILKRQSVWILSGSGSSSFALRRFSDALGCSDANTVLSINDGCYFASDQGLMYFDGAQLVSVSDDIRTDLTSSYSTPFDVVGYAQNAHCEYIGRGYVMFTSSEQRIAGTVNTTPRIAAVFDTKLRTWTSFTTAAAPGQPLALIRANGRTYVFDGYVIYRVDTISRIGRDGNVTQGLDSLLGVEADIVAQWRSRIVGLASPTHRAQIHRVLIDHKSQFPAGADGVGNAWNVVVTTGDGQSLGTFAVPGQGNPTSYLMRRRHSQDVFGEAVDLQLWIYWLGGGAGALVAELHDATIEYQSTHQRAAA